MGLLLKYTLCFADSIQEVNAIRIWTAILFLFNVTFAVLE